MGGIGKFVKNTVDAVGDLFNDPLRALKKVPSILGMGGGGKSQSVPEAPKIPGSPPIAPKSFIRPADVISADVIDKLKDESRVSGKSTRKTGPRGVPDEEVKYTSLLGGANPTD